MAIQTKFCNSNVQTYVCNMHVYRCVYRCAYRCVARQQMRLHIKISESIFQTCHHLSKLQNFTKYAATRYPVMKKYWVNSIPAYSEALKTSGYKCKFRCQKNSININRENTEKGKCVAWTRQNDSQILLSTLKISKAF